MKRKMFLVILVLIITILNLILFSNFYHNKEERNKDRIQINSSKVL